MESTYVLFVALLLSVTSPSSVQGNKVLHLISNQIYHLNQEEKIFASAEDTCEEKDGTLAIVKDLADLELLAQKLFDGSSDESIIRETKNISKFYWIGLQRSQKGKWSFTDGTPYRSKTQLPMTPWNATDESDYNCAGIVTSGLQPPTLRKQSCFHEAPFICQFEARPCVPKMILNSTAHTNDDIYISCNAMAVKSQRQFIANDCECPMGSNSNISTEVVCNSKNWFYSSVCVPGCSLPHLPPMAVVVDPKGTYWLGDEMMIMCMDANATENSSFLYHQRWRCVEGGLWFGNRDGFCTNPGKSINKSILKFVTESHKRVTMECNVPGQKEGIKPTSWLWFKGGKQLESSGSGGVNYVMKGEKLIIEKFTSSSAGSYSCFGRYKGTTLGGNSYLISVPAEYLSNSCGSTSAIIKLTILDKRLIMGLFMMLVWRHIPF